MNQSATVRSADGESGHETGGKGDDEGDDLTFSLVAGLYVGVLVAPAVVLSVSLVSRDAGVLYVALLAAVTGVTVAATRAISRSSGVAVAIGARRASWGLVAVPLAWVGAVFAADASGVQLPDAAAPLALLVSLVGPFLGLAVLAMGRNRHARAALVDAAELAQWDSRWPRAWRHGAYALLGLAGAASVAGAAVSVVSSVGWSTWNSLLPLYVAMPLASGVANPRTYRATEAGLVVDRVVVRHLRSWDRYASYTVTDEALVIHAAARWRPAIRCDRADVEDLDAAIAALDEVLPRRP